MKYLLFFLIPIYLIGLLYLLLPSPVYPDLFPAERSTEDGDTWQNPDQKGYYTNLTRSEVFANIQSQFAVKLFNFTIPSYRLNYRPEESYELVRDQLSSYYLEEIIYPFRESLFVNGWEPKNSPRYRNVNPKDIPNISWQGIPYLSKVTLKPLNSNPLARVLVWTLLFPASFLVYYTTRRTLLS